MDSACTLGAFATTMSGPQPLWSSVIGVGDPGCITSLAYDIADDSSSVVTLTGSAITKYDATTGIFLLSFDVGTAINPGAHYTPVAISLDRDGTP